jgi:hypothetical protein
MTAIAHEVSRRMTPGYAKERAREMARERVSEVRDRAVENPWLGPLLGAGIGALIGRAFMSRVEERRRERWYEDRRFGDGRYARYGRDGYGFGYGYPADVEVWADEDVDAGYEGSLRSGSSFEGEETSGGGIAARASEAASSIGSRASETASSIGDRATEMKDRLAGKAGEMGERMRARADTLRSRMPDRHAVRSNAQEQPALWALGAAAIGALFGFALPLSDKERQVIEPARQKMREATHQAMDKAVEAVEAKGGGREDEQRPPSQDTGSTLIVPPGPTQTPDLH